MKQQKATNKHLPSYTKPNDSKDGKETKLYNDRPKPSRNPTNKTYKKHHDLKGESTMKGDEILTFNPSLD